MVAKPPRRPRLPCAPLALLACLIAIGSTPSGAGADAQKSFFPPVAGNPADRLLAFRIDDYRYDYARRCRRNPTRGALALQSWLARHAAGESWGIMRCEKLARRAYSLHAEGRALDWHLDARNPADRRAAERLIALLLAEDRAGNPHALARRMGVQEIIWDCRSWWSGAPRLGRYSACYSRDSRRRRRVDDSTAHRNHVHVGLSWPGARQRTTFWAAR
jgi:hypothetical protein